MTQLANYALWCEDIAGSRVFHAEQFGADDWRYTAAGINGMIVANRFSLVNALAQYVGTGRIVKVTAPASGAPGGGLVLYIDECRNTWLDGQYLPASQWIPAIVTVTAPAEAAIP